MSLPVKDQRPLIGSTVIQDGTEWIIVDVMARFTPYRRKGQETQIEGWTLGLKKYRQ